MEHLSDLWNITSAIKVEYEKSCAGKISRNFEEIHEFFAKKKMKYWILKYHVKQGVLFEIPKKSPPANSCDVLWNYYKSPLNSEFGTYIDILWNLFMYLHPECYMDKYQLHLKKYALKSCGKYYIIRHFAVKHSYYKNMSSKREMLLFPNCEDTNMALHDIYAHENQLGLFYGNFPFIDLYRENKIPFHVDMRYALNNNRYKRARIYAFLLCIRKKLPKDIRNLISAYLTIM